MPRNGSRFTEAHGRGATLALLILAALAVAACSSGVDIGSTTLPTPSPEPAETTDEATTVADEPDLPVLSDLEAPEWRPATRTEELALDIDEAGEPTPQHAVDAFGLLVDGMPGTTPTDLPPGEALGETYTLLLIRAFRDQLTPEQQLVVDEHLDAGTVIATIAADGTIEIAPEESEIDDDPADDPTPGPSGLRHSGPPATTTDVDALAALLGGVQEAWNQRLPGHPSFGIELAKTDLPLKQIDALPKDNDPRTCVISVHAGFLGAAPSDDQLRWAFAHELFHCMQFIWQTAQLPPPDWLIEGSADFAATDLFRTATLDYDGLGHQWFTEAEAPLVARTYSAWGLFENASVSGLDAYARIEAMVASPAQTVGQFLTAGQLDGLIFRKDWSTRTLRSNSLGPTWQLGWPKPDAGFGPHDNVFSHGARGVGTYNI
ncbi:MAG: hypothetical protein OEU32_16050, partial [Acidimicrobiia bacterium]|nr:hypothetical protein [Acidimicrobiia bacterium]